MLSDANLAFGYNISSAILRAALFIFPAGLVPAEYPINLPSVSVLAASAPRMDLA